MVPHALFVSSDRSVDLALNLLTLVVLGALIVSMAALAYFWLNPRVTIRDRGDVGPPVWAAMSESVGAPSKIDFDLPLPNFATIYRCDHLGEITFSDRPCPLGRVRALKLRPS